MIRTTIAAGAAAAAVTFGAVTVAGAHQPVFVDAGDTTDASAPLLRDATVSFAVYGEVASPGDRRLVRAELRAGDTFVAELLVPAVPPEIDLPVEVLPVVRVTDPAGAESLLRPAIGARFDEPFSRTSYVRLGELRQPAVPGTYRLEVVGAGPARFTLAVGSREVRGEVDNDEPTPADALRRWYGTPVAAAAVAAAPAAPANTLAASASAPAPAPVSAAAAPGAPGWVESAQGSDDETETTSARRSPLGMIVQIGLGAVLLAVGAVMWLRRRQSPPPGDDPAAPTAD